MLQEVALNAARSTTYAPDICEKVPENLGQIQNGSISWMTDVLISIENIEDRLFGSSPKTSSPQGVQESPPMGEINKAEIIRQAIETACGRLRRIQERLSN